MVNLDLGGKLRIIAFDGDYVTYEAFTPIWTFEELDLRDQRRRFESMKAQGLDPEWTETDRWTTGDNGKQVNLPGISPNSKHLYFVWSRAELERCSEERAGDERENRGWRRSDARPVYRRFVKEKLEKVADRLGVSTALDDWRRMTLEALKAAPPRGRVGMEGETDE